MKNKRAFIVKYMPCTERKPAGIMVTDLRHKKSKRLKFPHGLSNDIALVAEAFLEDLGIKVDSQSEGSHYTILTSSNFTTQIK